MRSKPRPRRAARYWPRRRRRRLIEQLAATLVERTYIANYNAPDQNVVGGSPQTLKQLADLLGAQGHKAQLLNVPCPYHTPLMAGSGPILKRRLDALRLRTPQVSLLSSVTNRYVAEPEEIRENLAAQLTTPVRYVELVERLADEQSTVFIEVGPQQALTKLTRRILEGRSPAGIVASDNPKLGGTEQLAHVRALLECLGVLGSQPLAAAAPASAVSTRSVQPVMTKPAKGNITHFDATQRRIEKMRRVRRPKGAPRATATRRRVLPIRTPTAPTGRTDRMGPTEPMPRRRRCATARLPVIMRRRHARP